MCSGREHKATGVRLQKRAAEVGDANDLAPDERVGDSTLRQGMLDPGRAQRGSQDIRGDCFYLALAENAERTSVNRPRLRLANVKTVPSAV
jgi:hypothetical protein